MTTTFFYTQNWWKMLDFHISIVFRETGRYGRKVVSSNLQNTKNAQQLKAPFPAARRRQDSRLAAAAANSVGDPAHGRSGLGPGPALPDGQHCPTVSRPSQWSGPPRARPSSAVTWGQSLLPQTPVSPPVPCVMTWPGSLTEPQENKVQVCIQGRVCRRSLAF